MFDEPATQLLQGSIYQPACPEQREVCPVPRIQSQLLHVSAGRVPLRAAEMWAELKSLR